jgi:predicted nuclease with RNAse H fold
MGSTTLTLGIDLSSSEEGTAACLLEWSSRTVAIDRLAPSHGSKGLNNRNLLQLITMAGRTGIDSPFGWPEPFVKAITDWQQRKPWRWETRSELRYRRTDEQMRGVARMPLSVSTERLGATAMRCAHLLSQIGGVDRSGERGPVVEVYPAAALRHWGLPFEGYKSATKPAAAAEKRREILAGLRTGLGAAWKPTRIEMARLVDEHDLLDALVAALVARAVELGQATRAEGRENQLLARTEGWIRVPTCSISELVDEQGASRQLRGAGPSPLRRTVKPR